MSGLNNSFAALSLGNGTTSEEESTASEDEEELIDDNKENAAILSGDNNDKANSSTAKPAATLEITMSSKDSNSNVTGEPAVTSDIMKNFQSELFAISERNERREKALEKKFGKMIKGLETKMQEKNKVLQQDNKVLKERTTFLEEDNKVLKRKVKKLEKDVYIHKLLTTSAEYVNTMVMEVAALIVEEDPVLRPIPFNNNINNNNKQKKFGLVDIQKTPTYRRLKTSQPTQNNGVWKIVSPAKNTLYNAKHGRNELNHRVTKSVLPAVEAKIQREVISQRRKLPGAQASSYAKIMQDALENVRPNVERLAVDDEKE